VRNVTNGACGQPGRAPAPNPFDRHLEPFAPSFSSRDDALNDLSDNLFALRHRRGGCVPQRGDVLRQLRDRLPLGLRQQWGLRLHEARIVLLQLAVGQQSAFPLFGELACHQAVLGLDQAVMAGSPFRLIGGSLQTLLPQLVEGLPFLLQVRGRLQREAQGRRFERGEDPLADEGIGSCT